MVQYIFYSIPIINTWEINPIIILRIVYTMVKILPSKYDVDYKPIYR